MSNSKQKVYDVHYALKEIIQAGKITELSQNALYGNTVIDVLETYPANKAPLP